MVEFNHNVRFYYVNRPNQLLNPTNATDALGLDLKEVHAVVINCGFDGLLQKIGWGRTFPEGVWENRLKWDFYAFPKMQMRDIGRWFGADNPWITEAPDHMHGCMPGPPDDEANLLLFLLLGWIQAGKRLMEF